MATTSTPHLSLVKPTPGTDEPASVAVLNSNADIIDAWADGVDAKVTDGWSSYTPVWTKQSGTAPSLGNGTLEGRFKQIGKIVFWELRFVWGSTTNANGTELWLFSLPVNANQFGNAVGGHFGVSDASGNWFTGTVLISTGGNTLRLRVDGIGSGQSLTSTIPMAWAASDEVTMQGFYEAA